MAEAYSGEGTLGGYPTRKFRCYLNAYVENLNDNTCRVHWYAQSEMQHACLYGMRTYVFVNGSHVASGEGVLFSDPGSSWQEVCSAGWGATDFARDKNAYQVTVVGRASAEEVNGYGGNWGSRDATITLTIPARPYYAHGKPTIKASKTTANYGESVTISWAKSGTQGNANFDRFELWQGRNKLYSGSGISKSVVPSDATGAQGGTATYTLKEIHEWYGTYPETSTTISVTVRSGVVSVYDSSGTKHTGLVTAYDSSGNSHFVLITAYDANGSPHSVV